MATFERVGARATLEGVSGYIRDAQRVNRATGSIGDSARRSGSAFGVSARQAVAFGAGLAGVTLAATAAAASLRFAIGDTVGAAIAFESSFTGIRKTMDLAEADFERLAQANRSLAKEIPISVNEINRIGELAGQLGVRGVENVLKFERSIGQLAITTDVTAERGALAFAQIQNVLGESSSNVDRLASALVDLGNNSATVESKILDFATRIAGAGKLAGLTSAQVFGISAAFASAGNEAEAGGTAIQKVLISMIEAVNSGGEELEIFAAVAGVTVEEFVELFERDAAEAFTAFVEGLASAGDDAFVVLSRLGLEDQRLIRSFTTTAAAGDQLRRSIETGTNAYEQNTAAAEEFGRFADTNASKIQLLRNAINDIQITAGNAVLLGLEPLIDATNDWLATNGDQFGKDLADSIEGGIEFAKDLGEELRNIADLLNTIASAPVIDLVMRIAMSQADKILLAGLAAVAGLAVAGPLGAVIGIGVVGAGTTIPGLFADNERPTTAEDRLQSDLERRVLEAASERLGVTPELVQRGIEAGLVQLFSQPGQPTDVLPTGEQLSLAEQAAGRRSSTSRQARDIARALLANLNRGGVSFDVPLPPVSTRGGGGLNLPPPRTGRSGPDPQEVRRREFAEISSQVQRAQERLERERLDAVETFGRLVISGLERQAAAELDVRLSSLDAQREAVIEGTRERIRAIETERDAAIRAIEEERDARVAALEAQLGTIDIQREAEELAELQRELALAFDPRDRADVEARIREFERRQRERAIRQQIRQVNEAADEEISEAQRAADERIEQLEREEMEQLESLGRQREAARDTYDEITDEFALQSRARELIMGGEMDALARLLDEHVPEWREAGQSFGESLIAGLESVGLADFVNDALSLIEGTSQRQQAELERAAAIAQWEEQADTLIEGGAPKFVVDDLRKRFIEEFGQFPSFQGGGVMRRDGLAFLHANELVLTPQQQAAVGGMTVNMNLDFSGANLTGTVDENAEAMQGAVREVLEDKFGRDAFLWGVRR